MAIGLICLMRLFIFIVFMAKGKFSEGKYATLIALFAEKMKKGEPLTDSISWYAKKKFYAYR